MAHVITAREFMRRELVTLKPQDGLAQAVSRMLEHRITGAPVVDPDGNYLGVLGEKSCIQAISQAIGESGDDADDLPRAHDFMVRKVFALRPDTDVFTALDNLLSKRFSGAPIVDEQHRFLGVFSEKTAMQVVVGALYEHVPGSTVRRYMNLDRNRLLDPQASLLETADVFVNTPYRRLPVLTETEQLQGQVSRRDVIASAQGLISARHITSWEQQPLGDFIDRHALTKSPDSDLLEIAEAFLNSPYRRLPILDGKKLVGQVSRRDLLEVACRLLRPKKDKEENKPLYLSAVTDTIPPSLE